MLQLSGCPSQWTRGEQEGRRWAPALSRFYGRTQVFFPGGAHALVSISTGLCSCVPRPQQAPVPLTATFLCSAGARGPRLQSQLWEVHRPRCVATTRRAIAEAPGHPPREPGGPECDTYHPFYLSGAGVEQVQTFQKVRKPHQLPMQVYLCWTKPLASQPDRPAHPHQDSRVPGP